MNCTCGHREEEHWKFASGDLCCIHVEEEEDDYDYYGFRVCAPICACTNFTNTSLVDNSW